MGAAPMKFQKKNGRQKMKKTMGSAPFLQIHFFRAHDPGIPIGWVSSVQHCLLQMQVMK